MGQKLGRESSPANPLTHPWWWGWGYLRNNWSEIAGFSMVDGANYAVDLAVFNLFLLWLTPQWPLFDRCMAVAVATIFSWIVNRSWTFRERGGHGVAKEALLFVLADAIGVLPPLACLWVSHYLLSFTSPLADNILANIIGLIIGIALYYVLYKLVAFPTKTTRPNQSRVLWSLHENRRGNVAFHRQVPGSSQALSPTDVGASTVQMHPQ